MACRALAYLHSARRRADQSTRLSIIRSARTAVRAYLILEKKLPIQVKMTQNRNPSSSWTYKGTLSYNSNFFWQWRLHTDLPTPNGQCEKKLKDTVPTSVLCGWRPCLTQVLRAADRQLTCMARPLQFVQSIACTFRRQRSGRHLGKTSKDVTKKTSVLSTLSMRLRRHVRASVTSRYLSTPITPHVIPSTVHYPSGLRTSRPPSYIHITSFCSGPVTCQPPTYATDDRTFPTKLKRKRKDFQSSSSYYKKKVILSTSNPISKSRSQQSFKPNYIHK